MGNEFAKKYDISENYVGTAGHNQLWKIFPCSVKEKEPSNAKENAALKRKEELSIWIFQKEELSKLKTIPDKTVQEQLFQIMRKDVLCFKDMSHSGIVRVVEVLEENKKVSAIVTEKIICSLADLLQRFEHIPGKYSWHSQHLEENGSISEIEISRGLLNISEGLQYMHNVKRRLHLGVSPGTSIIYPCI